MENLTFTLADFEGPLDLLLYLIGKNKMKIADIEIVSLIDQYLQLVNHAPDAGMDEASEFIEMAARLIYMKSVFLLPRNDEQDELREELTGMLVEYSACKEVAVRLGTLADGIFIAVRQPLELEQDMTYHIQHSPEELRRACKAIQGKQVRKAPPTRQEFDPIVTAPFVSVASRVVHVLRGLVTGKIHQLCGFFDKKCGRSENVATFLAVLELLKSGRITLDENEKITLRKSNTKRA